MPVMRSPEIFILLTFSWLHCSLAALPKYSQCSEEGVIIDSARGYVTSPGYPGEYPSDQKCKWTIVSSTGTGLKLRIEHLDNKEMFPGGTGQCYDKLRILSGTQGSLEYIDNDDLCAKNANELRKTVFEIPKSATESIEAQITFSSDYEDHNTGFSIFFETLCNSRQYGQSGAFSSPNYPKDYPNNAECYTEIRAPEGNHIEVEFSKLNVENQAKCETDYVAVTKGTTDLPIGATNRYCHTDLGKLLIESHIATIKFISDDNIVHSGFEATWRAVPPATPAPANTMMSNCSYTNDSRTCQRWDAITPHEPKHKPADPAHNFCRNPDGDKRGAWCYTTDPKHRWGYCDLENCVAPVESTPSSTTADLTTVNSQTTDASKSQISTSQSPTVVAVLEEVSPEKQVSDDASTGSSQFMYILIPIAVLLLLLLALIFVWRRRRRKGAARMGDPTLEDMVRFNQIERDENNGHQKENTYVEIPVGGIQQKGGRGRAPHKSANGFVALGRTGSKNSTVSSNDSIQMAKDEAKRDFVSVNAMAGTSSSHPYSAAFDCEAEGGAVGDKNPYNMASDDIAQATGFENVYHTIGLENEKLKKRADVSGSFVPPVPAGRPQSRSKSSKKGSEKKKENNKERTKRSKKKSSVLHLGFGNPSYRDNPSKGEESADNPFDTDDETKPTLSVAGPSSAAIPMSGRSRLHDQYDQSGSDTQRGSKADEFQPHQESPYMAPKLPLPNKAHMVPISPDAIDDKDEGNENSISLYSVPKPTSPVFDLGGNFIYDSPGNPRPARGSSESSVPQDEESSGVGRSSSTNTGRDSGNSSLSAIDSVEDEENRAEYCTMNSVHADRKPSAATRAKSKVGKDNADNRLSHLYMSMKGTPADTESVSKKVDENESRSSVNA